MKKTISIVFLSIILMSSVFATQIAIFPDTQFSTVYQDELTNLNNSLQSLVDQNISLILFTGDLTNNQSLYENDSSQEINMNNTFSMLYDKIPYIVSLGNHDIESGENYTNDLYYQNVLNKSSLIFFSNYSGYQLFNFENLSLGIVSLSYGYSDEEFLTAKSIIQNNSNYSFLLLTHWYFNNISDLNNLSNFIGIVEGHMNGKSVSFEAPHSASSEKADYYFIMNGHSAYNNEDHPENYLMMTFKENEIKVQSSLDLKELDAVLTYPNKSISFVDHSPPSNPVKEVKHSGGGGGSSPIKIENKTNSSEVPVILNVTSQNIQNETNQVNETINKIEIKEVKLNWFQRLLNFLGWLK